jgi:hypothetical protein
MRNMKSMWGEDATSGRDGDGMWASVLAPLVSNGTITQAQATAVTDAVTAYMGTRCEGSSTIGGSGSSMMGRSPSSAGGPGYSMM